MISNRWFPRYLRLLLEPRSLIIVLFYLRERHKHLKLFAGLVIIAAVVLMITSVWGDSLIVDEIPHIGAFADATPRPPRA